MRPARTDSGIRMVFRGAVATLLVLVLVSACAMRSSDEPRASQVPVAPTEDARLYDLLEREMQRVLATSPEFRTSLGIRDGQDRWDDYSDAFAVAEHAHARAFAAALDAIDRSALSYEARVYHAIARFEAEEDLADFPWRMHRYAVSQMHNPLDDAAALLVNFHTVGALEDARAYVARLESIGEVVDDVMDGMRAREGLDVLPPRFVFEQVIENLEGQMAGAPFDALPDARDSTLLGDLRGKVDALDLAVAERDALLASAAIALRTRWGPALERMISLLREQAGRATTDDGVWKLPDGDGYYARRVASWTTLPLDSGAVHARGLAEVERLHAEMRAIMDRVGFEGDLAAFFEYLESDPQFYYADTDAGREAYLEDTRAAIAEIDARLDDWFATRPRAGLVVRRVEAFREKNTSAAFYNTPSLDGSRPGIYFVPMHDMADNPKWDMMSTAFHEGLPGHHMQLAIAQELDDAPMMVRLLWFGAFGEGWALYAERLAHEMGIYDGRPYEDFGRLSSELFRAVRLVVDTGIHTQRWTRQQAIDYMAANTPLPIGMIEGEIERYIVWPGQATSYMIGMLTILELREAARDALGDAFDIRAFHDVVLTSGNVPLPVLRANVEAWVARTRSDGGVGAR